MSTPISHLDEMRACSAAAYYSSSADAADAAPAARSKTLKQCADIVRTFYPKLPT